MVSNFDFSHFLEIDFIATWFQCFQVKEFHLAELSVGQKHLNHFQSPRGNHLTIFLRANEEWVLMPATGSWANPKAGASSNSSQKCRLLDLILGGTHPQPPLIFYALVMYRPESYIFRYR